MNARPARRRAWRLALAPLAAALLLALVIGACGEKPSAPRGDPWPLSLDEPGLLAYVALALPAGLQADLLEGVTGWMPDGLQADAPLVLLHLDAGTYGGPLAIVLPVADRAALEASLAASPALRHEGGGRWRYTVPPDSPVRVLSMLISRMQGGSPLAMLGALTDAPSMSFGFDLADEGDHALLAPSFEAVGACRHVLRATGGLTAGSPHALVASADLARLRLVYAEQLRDAELQLRSVLSGAGTMGVMAMMRGGAEGGLQLPFHWELLWALKDMLSLNHVDALQLSVEASPAFWDSLAAAELPAVDADDADDAGAAHEHGPERQDERGSDRGGRSEGEDDEDEAPADFSGVLDAFLQLPELRVRLRHAAESPLRDVAASAAQVPGLQAAVLLVAAEPSRLAPALAAWCRPIAELVKGRGPPAQRYIDELAQLLGTWDGLLAVVPDGDRSVLLGSVGAGRTLDVEAWRQWLAPLLATARVQGAGGTLVTETRDDGAHVLRTADGDSILTHGLQAGVAWAALGDAPAPSAAVLAAFDAARAAAPDAADGTAPVTALRAAFPEGAAELAVHGEELQLTWRPAPRGR